MEKTLILRKIGPIALVPLPKSATNNVRSRDPSGSQESDTQPRCSPAVPEQAQGQASSPPSQMGHPGSLVMETFRWNWHPFPSTAVFFKCLGSR